MTKKAKNKKKQKTINKKKNKTTTTKKPCYNTSQFLTNPRKPCDLIVRCNDLGNMFILIGWTNN